MCSAPYQSVSGKANRNCSRYFQQRRILFRELITNVLVGLAEQHRDRGPRRAPPPVGLRWAPRLSPPAPRPRPWAGEGPGEEQRGWEPRAAARLGLVNVAKSKQARWPRGGRGGSEGGGREPPGRHKGAARREASARRARPAYRAISGLIRVRAGLLSPARLPGR